MKLAKHLVPVAFLFSAAAWASYDNSWYQSEFWSGEYPNGISVIEEGIVLPARTGMDIDLTADIQCAVPFKAVYHPWNNARPAKFFTASKIIPMVTKQELTLGEDADQITIPAGETVEYLVYGAEGSFLVRYKGVEYVAYQDLLEKVDYDKGMMDIPQDEWLKITCTGGENAWIFMRDVMTSDQEGNTVYPKGIDSWFRGFREYGVVTDLTDEDLGGQKP